MLISSRTIALRLVPVATLMVLGAGGIAAGTAAASPAAAAHGASIAPLAPPPVDHQLCYNAAGQFAIPSGIRLINQFSPSGFVPAINVAVVVHCNPVQKTLPSGGVFPITNPDAHLAC